MGTDRGGDALLRLRLSAGWLLVAALVLIFWTATNVVLMVFVAVLFAVSISGLSDWLRAHSPLGHGWALFAVLLGFLGLVSAVAWIVAPEVSEQVRELRQTLPRSVENLTENLEQSPWGRWLLDQVPSTNDLASQQGAAGNLLSRVGEVFSSTFAVVTNALLTLLVGVYLAAEGQQYREGALHLVPPDKRRRAEEIFSAVGHTIRWWLIGQMVSMLFLGVFSFIGLWLLDVPLALTLSLLTAVLAFIPNFGAIVSVVPPVILTLMESPKRALYVLIFYIILQVAEGNLVTPMIQRSAVRLPPALLITGQLLLAVLLGFWGLVLAAPLIAVSIVLVKKLYLEDTLGDRAVDQPAPKAT